MGHNVLENKQQQDGKNDMIPLSLIIFNKINMPHYYLEHLNIKGCHGIFTLRDNIFKYLKVPLLSLFFVSVTIKQKTGVWGYMTIKEKNIIVISKQTSEQKVHL